MPHHLQIDPGARLAVMRFSGVARPEEYRSAWDDLVQHPDWSPDFDALVETSGVTEVRMSGRDVGAVARRARELDEQIGTGWHALVGETDLHYGMCNVFAQRCQPCLRTIQVFRSVQAAKAWLSSHLHPDLHRDPQSVCQAIDAALGVAQ